MPVIYIDVLLCLNTFIDFLLLSATARLLHLPHRRIRVVAGSVIGALCAAAAILLPKLPLWGTLCLLCGGAAVMVRTAFRFLSLRAFLQQTGTLFGLSSLFAGVSYMLWLLVAPDGFTVVNGTVYYDVPPLLLIVMTLISYAAITAYDRLRERRLRTQQEYRLTVRHGGVEVSLRALYDTGNRLTECFSGSPVAVVRRDAVVAVLPKEWDAALAGNASQAAIAVRIRLIPFHSVGGSGVLPAFRPDKITVRTIDGSRRVVDGGYIAVTDALWRGEYDALIGNDVVALFAEERKTDI